MARISQQQQDPDVERSDSLVGVDGTGGTTNKFSLESIIALLVSGNGISFNLPTTEPTTSGELWNNNGVLSISS